MTRALRFTVLALVITGALSVYPALADPYQKGDLVLKAVPAQGVPDRIDLMNNGKTATPETRLLARVSPGAFPTDCPMVKKFYDAKLGALTFPVPSLKPGARCSIDTAYFTSMGFAAGPHILDLSWELDGAEVVKTVVSFTASGKKPAADGCSRAGAKKARGVDCCKKGAAKAVDDKCCQKGKR